ncbi:MAG TPA: Dabb family protein [Gemmataceae bacterium]|nr:Dabb family protein [Gemmataceae bacterium]
MICRMGLTAALVLVWTALAHGQEGKAAPQTAPYVHVVIFHLKKDAPKGTAEALIADAYELLAKIPSVRGIQAGLPAEKATPTYAKKDYQVGLLVLFDNYEGLETYLNHPLHTQYVEKHLKHVDESKLQVYDFIKPKK